MPATKWFDRTQPQTLMIAVLFLYFNAAFGLIYLIAGSRIEVVLVLGALAAWGIANERNWAYYLGVVVAALNVLTNLLGLNLINLLFAIALLALLLHPQSRSYRKTWFK